MELEEKKTRRNDDKEKKLSHWWFNIHSMVRTDLNFHAGDTWRRASYIGTAQFKSVETPLNSRHIWIPGLLENIGPKNVSISRLYTRPECDRMTSLREWRQLLLGFIEVWMPKESTVWLWLLYFVNSICYWNQSLEVSILACAFSITPMILGCFNEEHMQCTRSSLCSEGVTSKLLEYTFPVPQSPLSLKMWLAMLKLRWLLRPHYLNTYSQTTVHDLLTRLEFYVFTNMVWLACSGITLHNTLTI